MERRCRKTNADTQHPMHNALSLAWIFNEGRFRPMLKDHDDTDPRNHDDDETDEIIAEEEQAETTFQRKLNFDTAIMVLLVFVFFACGYYYLRHHIN